MKFKYVSRNPFRDFVRNLRRIATSTEDAEEKCKLYRTLYADMKQKLRATSQLLNNQTAFSQRCRHWNERDSNTIQLVSNLHNPWLRLKREFEQAVKYLTHTIKIEPNNVDAIYNLAVCQDKLNQKKKALQLYKKVLELDKEHTEARSNLAILQKALKK